MNKISSIKIQGFKSIRSMEEPLRLENLNVLIGANGSGKSNLISFFKLLSTMTSSPSSLQFHIAQQGGGNVMVFDGSAITTGITIAITIEKGREQYEYCFKLLSVPPDSLIFEDEKFRLKSNPDNPENDWTVLGSGHSESKLFINTSSIGRGIKSVTDKIGIYQFHNTSQTSKLRMRASMYDNVSIHSDGANIASILLKCKEEFKFTYNEIIETIRIINPFFEDFLLIPEGNHLLLRWKEFGSNMEFASHQASDGMLRIFALVTLLLQPPELLPDILIVDEPELGLHPYAIEIIAGLVKSVAVDRQVIVATQSTTFLDKFDSDDIIVVDRSNRETTFCRKGKNELRMWLKDFTLSELWNSNILGGRPQR